MSPTILRSGGFRFYFFYFFSNEESRMHIHVHHVDGEAKFWLEPEIELATSYGLDSRQLRTARTLIRRHRDEFREAWRAHFVR